jgi:hypothetical protein
LLDFYNAEDAKKDAEFAEKPFNDLKLQSGLLPNAKICCFILRFCDRNIAQVVSSGAQAKFYKENI